MRFCGDDGERDDTRVGLYGIEHSRRHPVEKRGPALRLNASGLAKTWMIRGAHPLGHSLRECLLHLRLASRLSPG